MLRFILTGFKINLQVIVCSLDLYFYQYVLILFYDTILGQCEGGHIGVYVHCAMLHDQFV